VKQACADLGVDPARSVVIGDIGSDVDAAAAAGAAGVLIPTPETRAGEIAAAGCVAATLGDAVAHILRGEW
jgi:beta-phosphoglucomutase-like phosphatase (HAD superfamily)